uniref:Uncharacterized protein n=1 Tax=Arion vulgaris TaxID=1028688 RepID=A0A0B7BFC6_9EUPU
MVMMWYTLVGGSVIRGKGSAGTFTAISRYNTGKEDSWAFVITTSSLTIDIKAVTMSLKRLNTQHSSKVVEYIGIHICMYTEQLNEYTLKSSG